MNRLDPNNPSPGDMLYVKFDRGISSVLDRFYRVISWDSKLKLHWIRYCLLPIMVIPKIMHTLRWYSENRHIPYSQLIYNLPKPIYLLLCILTNSYSWLNQRGLIYLVAPLFAFGFLVKLSKSSKSERLIRQKVTTSRVIGIVLNYVFMFMGAKYVLPSIYKIIIIILVITAAFDLFRIPALHHFQKVNGPLDVERFQAKRNRIMRKQEKENRLKNGRSKKKHGR